MTCLLPSVTAVMVKGALTQSLRLNVLPTDCVIGGVDVGAVPRYRLGTAIMIAKSIYGGR